jgi:hypothetical protein
MLFTAYRLTAAGRRDIASTPAGNRIVFGGITA